MTFSCYYSSSEATLGRVGVTDIAERRQCSYPPLLGERLCEVGVADPDAKRPR